MPTTTCPTPLDLFGPGPRIWTTTFTEHDVNEEHEGHPEFDAVDLDTWGLYAQNASLARALVNRLMDEDLPTERRASDDEDRRLAILSAENYAGQAWVQLTHLIRTLKELAR